MFLLYNSMFTFYTRSNRISIPTEKHYKRMVFDTISTLVVYQCESALITDKNSLIAQILYSK